MNELIEYATLIVIFFILPAAIGYAIEYREEPPKDI